MADIILKDRDGFDGEYLGVKAVKFNTTDGGTKTFIEGETGTTTVAPDFSEGDMVVTPEDGILLTEVTIQKPENLLPENILKDVDIAGVVGTLELPEGGSVPFATGTFKGTGSSTTVTHGLGVVPDLVIILPEGSSAGGAAGKLLALYHWTDALKTKLSATYSYAALLAKASTTNSVERMISSPEAAYGRTVYNLNAETFKVGSEYVPLSSSSYTYRYFVIGGLT